jgi:ABC-2 type transport system ATP-binding protein
MKQGEIVALDSTQNLLNRLPGKNLQLKLADALPTSLMDLVKFADGLDYTLALNEVAQVEFVLTELRAANVAVVDMQLIEADLEDVFVNLVGRA